MNAGLPWRHALLALAVVAVWGTNFVVIKIALAQLPPLLPAALRFTIAFVPAALFIARPPWRGRGWPLMACSSGPASSACCFLP
jgi:O-acetylserine/cysteine efflux transporter